MADPPKVAAQRASVPPGQAATCRVAAEPPITAPAPDPSRRVSPDATGLYEADSGDPKQNSPRMLSLNQAGQALVGWLTIPPSFVTPVPQLADQLPGHEAVRFAVLVADLDPKFKTARGFSFAYRDLDTIVNKDPNVVLDPDNPWDRSVDQSSDKELRHGFITFTQLAGPLSPGWDEAVPRLSASVVFTRSDNSELPPLSFTMVDPRARVSERSIDSQDAAVRNFLNTHHRRPIPHSFFDTSQASGQQWKDARSLFAPDPSSPLAVLIKAYDDVKGSPAVQRMGPRDKIADLLSARLSGWDGTSYKTFLNTLLARECMKNKVTINNDTKSYAEWLAGIAANETQNQQNAGNTATSAPNLEAYPHQFDWVMGGANIFRYKITFDPIPVGTTILGHKVGTDLPDQGTVASRTGVAAALGAVQMTVAPSSGSATTDGKMPDDSHFTPSKKTGRFFAVFFELKGGLGDPPKFPKEFTLTSGTQLSADDFEGAMFEMYALDASATAGGKVDNPLMTMGAAVKSGGNTFLLRFHVGGQVLEGTFADGTIEPHFEWTKPKPKVPDFGAIKRIASTRGIAKDSDFVKPKLSSPVSAGVSLGCGRVVHAVDPTTWLKPPPKPGTAVLQGGDGCTVPAFFDRDKDDITKRTVNGWTVRFLLETILATNLALFDGAPAVDIEGFASPEGTPQHNLLLSKRRAIAVRQAIMDAVPIDGDLVGADGRGDFMAHLEKGQGGGGLAEPNPCGDQDELKKYESAHKEEVDNVWPQWRKVDIDIRGRFFMTVVTVAQGDSP